MSPSSIVRFRWYARQQRIRPQPHFLIDVPSKSEELEYPTEKIVDNDSAIDKLDGMLEAVVEKGTGTQAHRGLSCGWQDGHGRDR